MKPWRRKIALMRLFGAMPFGDRLFDEFRYRFGGLRTHNLDKRWYSIVEMLRMIRGAGIPVAGKDLAEIGSGWHPLLAPMFHGLGAATIRMTDISPHARTEFVDATVSYLIKRVGEISELSGVDAATLEKRWRKILPNGRPWTNVFAAEGITYSAPLDFTKSGWPSASIDLVYSNSCICYIPEAILRRIFAEMRRILRPGGSIAHNIDPVDVLTGDLNFLNFSRDEWERVGTCKLHYQSRLRPADYIKMARDNGFEVTMEERLPFPKPLQLDRARMHPDFRNLPESELLCFHFLLAGRKAVTAAPAAADQELAARS